MSSLNFSISFLEAEILLVDRPLGDLCVGCSVTGDPKRAGSGDEMENFYTYDGHDNGT